MEKIDFQNLKSEFFGNFKKIKLIFFENSEISKSNGQYTYEITKFPARFQKFQKCLKITFFSKSSNFFDFKF